MYFKDFDKWNNVKKRIHSGGISKRFMIYDLRFRNGVMIWVVVVLLFFLSVQIAKAEQPCRLLWQILKNREACNSTVVKVDGYIFEIIEPKNLYNTNYQYGFLLRDDNRDVVRVLTPDPIVLVEGKVVTVKGTFYKEVDSLFEDTIVAKGEMITLPFTASELYQDILADYGKKINLLKHYENWSLVAVGVVPLLLIGVFFFGYWFYQRRRIKGRTFEGYIESLFPRQDWAILESQAYRKLGRWVSSYSNPDFLFLHRRTKKKVAVECKFKISLGTDQNRIIWADEEQIEKYSQFSEQKKVPVFVVIGVGGNPQRPRRMFLLPLRKIHYPNVAVEYLMKFERNPSPAFSIEELQKVYAEEN